MILQEIYLVFIKNNIIPLIESDFASSEKLDSIYSYFRNES